MVDTSVWLDLAKKRDGQKLIHAIAQIIMDGDLELLVPAVVIDEFERNRGRIEQSMTTSVADRFKALRVDLKDLSAMHHRPAFDAIDALAHEMPMIGAMATRNFNDILGLLQQGVTVEPDEAIESRVIRRGLDKRAPFHRSKNSTGDALLIELYGVAASAADQDEPYGFVTSNYEDFSADKGDRRLPHHDIADFFDEHSHYFYRVEGLEQALSDNLGEAFTFVLDESDFQEDPRTLDEILQAEQEYFDRVWFERSVRYTDRWEAGHREPRATEESYRISVDAQERVRLRRPDLRAAEDDFERGMWNGKLSTLRWVLGSEWDFLDT
jgi:predicted nucleic acid-binding protein